ncbi:hypothetical protein NZA98_16650, partial [Escherichia coli]|nr:hypothetical protein [Escherichia coli]
MPTTTMPSTEKLISMARKLPSVRKCGETKLIAMQSARMMAMRPASRIEPNFFQDETRTVFAVIVSTAIRVSPNRSSGCMFWCMRRCM